MNVFSATDERIHDCFQDRLMEFAIFLSSDFITRPFDEIRHSILGRLTKLSINFICLTKFAIYLCNWLRNFTFFSRDHWQKLGFFPRSIDEMHDFLLEWRTKFDFFSEMIYEIRNLIPRSLNEIRDWFLYLFDETRDFLRTFWRNFSIFSAIVDEIMQYFPWLIDGIFFLSDWRNLCFLTTDWWNSRLFLL